ncbi:MAG TPA: hypothetical protein VLL97_10225 [Acidobacteriota bacterium]|nr:hypothetical protein [Acidobacteriota bacterium]
MSCKPARESLTGSLILLAFVVNVMANLMKQHISQIEESQAWDAEAYHGMSIWFV